MLIALDYDGTYTADPELWNAFILKARELGHNVKIATMRYPSEPIPDVGCEVIYTSRKAKFGCMPADIWIDDNPHFLFSGG
jgi:hypothetical protein